jgi:hypothetical protein
MHVVYFRIFITEFQTIYNTKILLLLLLPVYAVTVQKCPLRLSLQTTRTKYKQLIL